MADAIMQALADIRERLLDFEDRIDALENPGGLDGIDNANIASDIASLEGRVDEVERRLDDNEIDARPDSPFGWTG